MPVITFRCPHCSADLKTRDDHITANPVSCPECRKPIVIARDEFGNVTATAPSAAKASKSQKSAASGKPSSIPATKSQSTAQNTPIVREERVQAAPERVPPFSQLSRAAMAWIGAAAVGVATIIAVGILFSSRGSHKTADQAQDSIAPPKGALNSVVAGKGGAGALPKQANQAQNKTQPVVGPPTPAGRLTALGQRIAEYQSKQGHFPAAATGRAGLPPSDRLSWLAQLVANIPNRPGPAWNDSWRSTQNERFVRQQIPEFLNPSIAKVTGAENYPTTHFAGVAGVGADAADLPINDPRAGIFGNGRTTRMQDIRDGASNTLMVVGVTGDLGSWAAAGTPTVRAFTREPYVNGPDGIGTGSADRMLALKADGSVQDFSTKTDPRILRRMAAMADGLPLDPKVPGEPGEKSPQRPTADLTALLRKVQQGTNGTMVDEGAAKPGADTARVPIAAVRPAAKNSAGAPAAPVRKIDVPVALAQRVRRYEQIKPVPLRSLLNDLEDLVTVPIRGDKQEIADLDDLLQTPISVQLENTTVAGILEAVLTPAGLRYQVQPDAIVLHRLGSAPGRPASP